MSDLDLLKQNYFELFQLPVSFTLDLKSLKAKQEDLQKKFHPDKFASQDQQQQSLAMQISTHINTAFVSLKDNLKRASYLLKLQGVDLDSETDTQMPMTFLMKQMEVREALSEASMEESSLPLLDKMNVDVKQDEKEIILCLEKAFDDQDFSEARDLVRQFQFIKKLQSEINQKTASIEDALLS